MNKMIDVLGREKFVESIFYMMLKTSEKSRYLTFAIDAPWGYGKSFVLDMLSEKLSLEQNELTQTDRFLVIRYNSWEYDYYDEPIIAIIAAIQDSLLEQNIDSKLTNIENRGIKIAFETLKQIANQITKNKLGIEVANIIAASTEHDRDYDKLSGLKQTIGEVRKNIKKISELYTVVIMIDELDRCIPEYAIKILNRCSHLFSGIDNLQIIYSLYSKQFEHSIKMIFGNETEPDKYLKKFIDRKYILELGEVNDKLFDLFNGYFNEFDLENMGSDVILIIESFNLDIRSIEKIFEKIQLCNYIIKGENQPEILLFELVVSFLGHILGMDEIKNCMRIYSKDRLISLQCICKSDNLDKINEVFEDWSYRGINQHTIFNGNMYRLNDNIYGRLFACLNAVLGIDEERLLFAESDKDELISKCKEYIRVYSDKMPRVPE